MGRESNRKESIAMKKCSWERISLKKVEFHSEYTQWVSINFAGSVDVEKRTKCSWFRLCAKYMVCDRKEACLFSKGII